MPKTKLQQLFQLASDTVHSAIAERSDYKPMNDRQHPELYRLAVDVTLRPLILNQDLLPIFCEEEAVELLYALPNRFWFWNVLRGALLSIEDPEAQERLTAWNVAAAIVSMRLDYGPAYDLDIDFAELSADERHSRHYAGLIVQRRNADGVCEGPLIVNPIFAPCPNTERRSSQAVAAVTEMLRRHAAERP